MDIVEIQEQETDIYNQIFTFKRLAMECPSVFSPRVIVALLSILQICAKSRELEEVDTESNG